MPIGAGSRNIGVINDGVKPAPGTNGDGLQYDTYHGATPSTAEFFGYTFTSNYAFTHVLFQEGMLYSDGGWFETLKDAPLVTLDLAPEAAWVAEYYPTEASAERPGGGLTVTMRVRDPAWLRGLLLQLRGGATVIAPPGAGSSAAEAAQEALDQYRALFGPPRAAEVTGSSAS